MTTFDAEYYCGNCFAERQKMIKWIFLPRPTINEEFVVRVCEYCDGKELVRLATREGDFDASEE